MGYMASALPGPFLRGENGFSFVVEALISFNRADQAD